MTTVREVAMTKSARRIAESPRIVAISPVWAIATVSVNSDLPACFRVLGCKVVVDVDVDVVLVEDVVVVLVVLVVPVVVLVVVVERRSDSLLVILLVKITIEIPSSTGASALLR